MHVKVCTRSLKTGAVNSSRRGGRKVAVLRSALGRADFGCVGFGGAGTHWAVRVRNQNRLKQSKPLCVVPHPPPPLELTLLLSAEIITLY